MSENADIAAMAQRYSGLLGNAHDADDANDANDADLSQVSRVLRAWGNVCVGTYI